MTQTHEDKARYISESTSERKYNSIARNLFAAIEAGEASWISISEQLLAAEQRGIERAARLVEILGITDFDAGPEAPGKMISGRVLIDNTPTREETASAIRSLSPKAEG